MSAVKAPPHIFRAYDIRGIFNKDISPSVFLSIGLALGALAEERGWHRWRCRRQGHSQDFGCVGEGASGGSARCWR
nr:hypothetical protein [Methanophagales archaeon]